MAAGQMQAEIQTQIQSGGHSCQPLAIDQQQTEQAECLQADPKPIADWSECTSSE